MTSAKRKLEEFTECSICLTKFKDPRMLTCFHTFCLRCLEQIAKNARKNSGDKIPCPLCKNEFVIPPDGMTGLQKNFLLENLFEIKQELGSDRNVKLCQTHNGQNLDYYCVPCKKLVCISCIDKKHQRHERKEVNAFQEELRSTIKIKSAELNRYAKEVFSEKQDIKRRKVEFLTNLDEERNSVLKRSQDMISLINQHTNSLLEELSTLREEQLKGIDKKLEEVETECGVLKEFEDQCIELLSKKSAADMCESFGQNMGRFDAMEKGPDRPFLVTEVLFCANESMKPSNPPGDNWVGQFKVSTGKTEDLRNCAFVMGMDDGTRITNDFIKLNLKIPNEIHNLENVPADMKIEAYAVTRDNAIYVTGIGRQSNEIWKYSFIYRWEHCACLVQGRRRHSAAFVNEVLYICGGFVDAGNKGLDSVEAFDTSTDECEKVGNLVHPIKSSGNCVPHKNLLYIFGGMDAHGNVSADVVVYDTLRNDSWKLWNPMPAGHGLMRAVCWQNSVILLGMHACYIFDPETDTWQERKQFKADVYHFGLALCDEQLFVIGGGTYKTEANGTYTWAC